METIESNTIRCTGKFTYHKRDFNKYQSSFRKNIKNNFQRSLELTVKEIAYKRKFVPIRLTRLRK